MLQRIMQQLEIHSLLHSRILADPLVQYICNCCTYSIMFQCKRFISQCYQVLIILVSNTIFYLLSSEAKKQFR
jgi:hypothetical protein